ncbi:RNA ligase RtcB family protein [Rhabdaerophilum sp. SD176]|uniref:RNA ligase RtcB family protein n=1 Tax=Rhabdaerophilum sp. SD176 TaxID=2983548 RepID=UPI0024DF7A60|nr:RNA ligase RtcB family protein [Rhabdaerophilum sp. SD176]
MGTPRLVGASSRIHLFASSTAWIEDAAVRQLEQLADRRGMRAVAGMPDLHPGHHGPVGCAAEAEGSVHADIVGTDIGCGMQFWSLDIPERKLRLDKAAERLWTLEGHWSGNAEARLEEDLPTEGLDVSPFAGALGTIGGGNHFCEVQAVVEIVDSDAASAAGLEMGSIGLLVHSGSRGFGAAVLARHYHAGTEGLPLEGGGLAYLRDHDRALAYARLNRQVIAERAMASLRTEGVLRLDVPHNLAERKGSRILHRKGAAPSDRGLVPVPGSRGAVTYLVAPLEAPSEALCSIAHGAGRKHDRASMERRVRTSAGDLERLARNPFGGRVICTDRQLLIEEAPDAYKDIHKVIADLEAMNLVQVVAILRPVVTFKTARQIRRIEPRNGWKDKR